MSHFYKNKTILITGATGFKGAWLSLWLHSLGANVIWYSLAPETKPNLFSLLELEKSTTQIFWDINNISHLQEVCDTYKPEIVFHLAAQALVRESYRNPVHTFQTNVMGTVNVLEVIRQSKSVSGAVLITTDKVYENTETMTPYKENDRLGWYDPYSSSKAMDEIAITSYVRSFFSHWEKKIVSVRAGNVIGWGDWSAERLIPDMVRAFEKNETMVLRNPDAVRPWQHVFEALSGYLMMGEKIFEDDRFVWAYNFGPDISDTMRVEDLMKKAIDILRMGKYEIKKDETLHEAGLLLLDNSKAKILLWWKPSYTLDEALQKTFQWYKAYADGENMKDYSLQQIQDFIR